MRKIVLFFACLFALSATPALAETPTEKAAIQWEIGYQVLNALDTAQTLECMHRNACVEANPLFGRHPDDTRLILGKLAIGALHLGIFKFAYDRDPKAALRMAQFSVVVQGGVVLANARITFK
jgi:hypothetical protein